MQRRLQMNFHKPLSIDTANPHVCNLNIFPEDGYTDPHALVENGKLFVICGHDKSMYEERTWVMDRWEILSTSDLVNWQKESMILPTDTYIGDQPNCWAGDIVKKGSKYYWYFSNRDLSTGVMVADSPTGPFKDVLGKPLLTRELTKDVPPYDPAIFEEDGEYTIFFGSRVYHAAKLSVDMLSIVEEPQPILVLDKDGKPVYTDDKSTVFKRNDIYYLVWGSYYAISDKLRGPYEYQGRFLEAGHNDVFEWEGNWYVISENLDISIFYRGISLKPLTFHEDGRVFIPKDDQGYPPNGRKWLFQSSTMGWRSIQGTTLKWDNSCSIRGEISGQAVIESAVWPITDLFAYGKLKLSLKNSSESTRARIYISSIPSISPETGYWNTPQSDWQKEAVYELEISAGDEEYKAYNIVLSTHPSLKRYLKRIRIELAVGVKQGTWAIDSLSIE
jgi:arabinoxylan arabinofuranohydrolase